ncbi:4483_t:CDS:2, partial [Acaulospora colombiana]
RHHQLAERGRYHEVRSDGSSSPPTVPLLKSRTPSHVKRDEVQYQLLGCFSELSDGSLLLDNVAPWNGTSLQTCIESCYTFSSTPFVYAGVFNGNECRCRNELPAGATQVEQSNCKTTCITGTDQWCGGPNAYQVYKLPFIPTPPETSATQDPTQPVEEPAPSSSSLDGTIAESPAPSSDPTPSESPDGTIVDNPIPSPTTAISHPMRLEAVLVRRHKTSRRGYTSSADQEHRMLMRHLPSMHSDPYSTPAYGYPELKQELAQRVGVIASDVKE